MEFENTVGDLALTINYPTISDSIIKYLTEICPDNLPRTQISDFELGKLVGKQELIDHLKEAKKWSEEGIMNKDLFDV